MHRGIVVIGASAGGIEALRTIASSLPADFPSPIALGMHTAPDSPAILHDILNRRRDERIAGAPGVGSTAARQQLLSNLLQRATASPWMISTATPTR